MQTLKDYLKEVKKLNRITLFLDIETFQYNEARGYVKPSEFKNMTFSVACSWLDDFGNVSIEVFANFKDFFNVIIETYKKGKTPTIELNYHNGNKYDNHFMRYDLLYFYPHMHVENYFLTTATTDVSNYDSLRLKDLSKDDKQGIILEKRVKSSINLEMIFFLYGIQFETVDNWVKTNVSIKTLGKKLLRIGKVAESELKTDFDYLRHNKNEDMTTTEARA